MVTAYYTHACFLGHDPGPGHPERADRIRAIWQALDAPEFKALARREPPEATPEQLALAHPRAHVDEVLGALPNDGYAMFDGDTIASPGTREAALRAAGAVIAAVDEVMARQARNAFCAVRPPGHHAEPDRAMGFCLFNNVVIGAKHAMKKHGLTRVAMVDFDVHHGNGSETAARRDPHLFYGSTHQSPFYPGTGQSNDPGVPNLVNAPLPRGAGSLDFRRAMERIVLPALAEFAPELVMVSAGFDAHKRDPLAELNLIEDDYTWATEKLLEQATASAQGRLVSTLEGGYDLQALAGSTAAHVRALMAA
jgi:acetoin utilization deacetylase AcuC-like enzyme